MTNSVTKSTLAKSIFYETGIPVSMAEDILDTVFDNIISHAQNDGCVKIPNFGSFYVKKKNPRIGKNLNTGEDAKIEERKVISFKASAKLKQAINES